MRSASSTCAGKLGDNRHATYCTSGWYASTSPSRARIARAPFEARQTLYRNV